MVQVEALKTLCKVALQSDEENTTLWPQGSTCLAGMVRAEALKTLCKVAKRADVDRMPLLAAMALAGDKVLIKIGYGPNENRIRSS